jgi:uncharacterized protein (TIGR02466 family)
MKKQKRKIKPIRRKPMTGSTVDVNNSLNLNVIDGTITAPSSPPPAAAPEIVGSNTNETPKLQQWHYFPSVLYTIDKPEYIDLLTKISQEYLNAARQNQQLNEIYPVYMTQGFQNDARIADFVRFIGTTSWDILAGQGYNMTPFHTFLTELWCQEHHKFSGQDEHLHGNGNQISGFYFLEVPEESPRIAIHEPRPAKQYANLPEANMANATYASLAINFMPKAGQFMFTNSWLPHSFTKNPSKKPFRFIHFNVGIMPAPPQQQPVQQNNQTPQMISQAEVV